MRVPTHAVTGGFLYAFFAIPQGWPVTPSVLVAGLVGSVLPDIDTDRSSASLFPIGSWLKRLGINLSHEGFTHSLLGNLFFDGLAAAVLLRLDYKHEWFAFCLALFWHACEDALSSKNGIQWMFPLKRRYFLFRNEMFNVRSAAHEWIFISLMAPLTWGLTWVNSVGPVKLIDQAFADVTSVVEQLNAESSKFDFTVHVRGLDLVRSQFMEADFTVLGRSGNSASPWQQQLVLRGKNGIPVAVADGYAAGCQLKVDSILITNKRPVETVTHEIDMSGKLLSNLKRVVHVDHPHLLFGTLYVDETLGHDNSSALRFSPVQVSGTRIVLEFATVHDLESFGRVPVVVKSGNVVVRYRVPPGTPLTLREVPNDDHIVRFENTLPLQLHVKQGDVVAAGDVLVSVPERIKEIDVLKDKLKALTLQDASVREERDRVRRRSAQEKNSYQHKLEIAKKRHEDYAELLRIGAVARNTVVDANLKVVEAEDSLHDFEIQIQNSLAQLDSKLRGYETEKLDLEAKVSKESVGTYLKAEADSLVLDARLSREKSTYVAYLILTARKIPARK